MVLKASIVWYSQPRWKELINLSMTAVGKPKKVSVESNFENGFDANVPENDCQGLDMGNEGTTLAVTIRTSHRYLMCSIRMDVNDG